MLTEFTMPTIVPSKEDSVIYRYISRTFGIELIKATSPCNYPKVTRLFKDMQRELNITDVKIKEFKSGVSDQFKKFGLNNENFNVLLMIAILYYIRKGRDDIAREFFRFLGLKFYASRIHIHFPKYCNEELWLAAMDRLSVKHLFKVHKGVGSTIVYLSDSIFDKHKARLKDLSIDDKILTFPIFELRTRVRQSVLSFSELYYKLTDEKSINDVKNDKDLGSSLIPEKYSMIICVYGQIDKASLEYAIVSSGLRKDLAVSIITDLSINKCKDKLKFIMMLMGRLEEYNTICIEKTRNRMLRKINSKMLINDRYSIKKEMLNLMYSLKCSKKIRGINEDILIRFLSLYIITFIKNRIC